MAWVQIACVTILLATFANAAPAASSTVTPSKVNSAPTIIHVNSNSRTTLAKPTNSTGTVIVGSPSSASAGAKQRPARTVGESSHEDSSSDESKEKDEEIPLNHGQVYIHPAAAVAINDSPAAAGTDVGGAPVIKNQTRPITGGQKFGSQRPLFSVEN